MASSNTTLYPPISTGPYFTGAKASGGPKNNGSNIWYVGTPANTTFGSVPTKYLGYRSGFSANTPYKNAGIGQVTPGLSSGQWQAMRAGKYVMLTFCSDLAGTANTTLRFAANFVNKGGQNVMSQNFVRTTLYLSTGGWYYQTGQPVAVYGSVDSFNIENPSNPVEQYPGTRAIPGRIFYIAAGIPLNGVPNVFNYKVKTD